MVAKLINICQHGDHCIIFMLHIILLPLCLVRNWVAALARGTRTQTIGPRKSLLRRETSLASLFRLRRFAPQ